MKLAILALAAITPTAIAQDWPPYYDLQSKGFRLQLLSTNETLNGHVLGACHQGAAHEGLCLQKETIANESRPYTTFYHNVSSTYNTAANVDDEYGVLAWMLTVRTGTGDTTEDVPSAMEFKYRPESNLVDMIFGPGYNRYTAVAFEAGSDRMYIRANYNDLGSLPQYWTPALKLMNWYICLTRYSYTYNTLVWKAGIMGEPQNPTCQAVGVKRVWV